MNRKCVFFIFYDHICDFKHALLDKRKHNFKRRIFRLFYFDAKCLTMGVFLNMRNELVNGRKFGIWTIQQKGAGIITRFERLLHQQQGLHHTRLARTVRSCQNRERANLNPTFSVKRLEVLHGNRRDAFSF